MENRNSKKRRQLIETGKQLFLKHGVKRVTVEEICNKSNVSKVTFYKYFTNKPELLKTIRNELTETGFTKFDEIDQLDITYVEKISLMSEWRMEFFKSIKSEFLDEIIEINDFVKSYNDRFINGIKKAQARGEVRKEISPELVGLITEKLREVTIDGRWREIFNDYATYQNHLRKILFYGLLVDENHSKGEKE